MLERGMTVSSDGEPVQLHSNLPGTYADTLYDTILKYQPHTVVEIGMAYGVSSLAILTALRDLGGSRKLITIDPNQSSQWQGAGITAVARAGLQEHHQFIEDFDYHALPRLLGEGLTIEFGYIDGWHTFDYTLLDWWYIDKMLAVRGVVGFNDCAWPAVDKAIHFVLSHRKYVEIDVGLWPQFVGHSRVQEVRRRIARKKREEWYARAEDRYLQKLENWEPDFNFFAQF